MSDYSEGNPWRDRKGLTVAETRLAVQWELDKKASDRYQRERELNAAVRPLSRTARDLDPDRTWSDGDIIRASADIVAQWSGSPPDEPHPAAEVWRAAYLNPTVSDLLLTAHRAQGGRYPQLEPFPAIIAGLPTVSRNLGNILATAYQGSVSSTFDEASADLRAITAPVPAKDFKAHDFISVDAAALPKITEGGQIQTGELFGDTESYSVSSFGANLFISRQQVIGDDLGVLGRAIAALGAAVARSESQWAIGLLEANDNLADGQPAFSAAAGNLLAANALDAGGLDAAIAALRRLPTANGVEANATASFLLVPSDLEGLARRLNRDIDGPLQIVSVPWLNASGNWYVLPSPTTWPVIARAVPEWSSDTMKIEGLSRLPAADEVRSVSADGGTVTLSAGAFDAAGAVRVRRDTGYSLVSRFCIRSEPT